MNISLELIEACKKQDKKRQKELFDAGFKYVKNLCFRYLNDAKLLEDAIQETFISAFQHLDQFDPMKGTFKSWIGKIAINAALGLNRKKSYTERMEENKIKQLAIPAEAIVEMDAAGLMSFVNALREDYRTVFMMHSVDGFDHKEISEVLNIDETLSRKRLSRARQQLQEMLRSKDDQMNEVQKKSLS